MFFGTEAPASPAGASGPDIFALLRVVLALALVAGAVYGLVLFLKKKGAGQTKDDPYLKVLSRVSLNTKTSCAVVSIGDEAYLIGVSDENVSLLAKVNDKETIDAMLLENARAEFENGNKKISFRSLLTKLSAVFAKEKHDGLPLKDQIRARRERLGKL
jgi:flagellar protein FliO/FliZ